ncbi:MAG: 2-oxoglutarate dehydrogenase E2 component (dihydrolipoamide succinyltransferase) [Flavobacteriaceae bacterium]|jgi:2-oxoglutarate dehydrogenase E2 component (dihydrolipoamide succinyltransferase)|tara:strand:+ start:451 stop:1821 length:1371 start_codon:yes stop_codon:yes gene_type:complete
MGQYLLKLPKMGESVAEATITKWLMEIGDPISLDDAIVEIATDKVDTDVTAEVTGVLVEKRFKENEVVAVGDVLAVIAIDGEMSEESVSTPEKTLQYKAPEPSLSAVKEELVRAPEVLVEVLLDEIKTIQETVKITTKGSAKFYSPLVRNIAKEEGISPAVLDTIVGSGKHQRVTKKDILAFITNSSSSETASIKKIPQGHFYESKTEATSFVSPSDSLTGNDQIVEMTRMEKLISVNMTSSLQTAAHVQSFIEVDVTNLWNWREEAKNAFQKRESEKLTFTPLFMTAIIKALRDYPELNSSIRGDKIIIKQAINLGMATALSDGNLIVPVIKNADHFNLVGLAKAVNDLANRARKNTLKPDEVQDGTYTFTNIGNFGSIMGTPIINQPQVGILAIGAIRKMPAVIETPEGDFIGIRHKVILSHSYDHRVINGAAGGLFVKRVAEYLENWEETLPY